MIDTTFTIHDGRVDFYSEPAPRKISIKTARAWGLSRYFTGKLCKNGHIALRRVSQGKCTLCEKEYNKKWSSENPDKRLEIYARYRENNQEKIKIRIKKYYEENKQDYVRRRLKRRERTMHATPSWADSEQMQKVYNEASRLTETTGVPHEVDHIIPLQGDYVCGLHVHQNLRAIPVSKNRSKGKRFNL